MPQSTFNTWDSGCETGSGSRKPGFITTARRGRGYTVPFVGRAAAWIVRAFTRAGVPVSSIRPALEVLRTEIVREHLRFVDYRDGFIGQLSIPRSDGADLTVDPQINFDQPTPKRYGIRVDDVLDRISAGESIDDVAADLSLPTKTGSNLALAAA